MRMKSSRRHEILKLTRKLGVLRIRDLAPYGIHPEYGA